MRLDAIIFDLDGTLLDSLNELALSANAALEAMGLPTHAVDDYRTFVGGGMDKLFERSLPEESRHDEATRARIVEAMRLEYGKHWHESRPFHGVDRMLDALVERGMPVAVLSNKPDAYTRRIVDNCMGRWPWAQVRGALPDVPLKPDPTAVLDMARALGLDPARTAYMGDSDVDMFTAKAAGMTALGASWGFRGPRELADSGADILLDHPQDLLHHLDA